MLMDIQKKKQLKEQILELVRQYHDVAFPGSTFFPGVTHIPASGKVFDAEDMQNLVESGLDFWLTTGRFASRFEKQCADVVGMKHCSLVNSGSSANLVALTALTSPTLGERQLKPGDEVITVASGFPTTVNPIFQNQLVPVFLDVTIPTYNIDVTALASALTSKTKAIMIAHTLGNPFDLDAVSAFAKEHGLWLIEDCCDALGSTYKGKHVGTFGDIATVSFYPAHHITMGEGGAVFTNNTKLKILIESFRDWGRDCWCNPGASNSCGKRFQWKLGGLPYGFDHKYIYSHIGYNLKLTDMQAAVGLSQLKKLPGFIAKRRENFAYLRKALRPLDDLLILPEATEGSDPSWFGFAITLSEKVKRSRLEVIDHLEKNNIATRLLFGGNLIHQPAYQGKNFRVVGTVPTADIIMNRTFWIGLYPAIDKQRMDYMAQCMKEALRA